jgi:hypothetical protein
MRFLRIPDLNKEFSWQFFDQSSDFCPKTDPLALQLSIRQGSGSSGLEGSITKPLSLFRIFLCYILIICIAFHFRPSLQEQNGTTRQLFSRNTEDLNDDR